MAVLNKLFSIIKYKDSGQYEAFFSFFPGQPFSDVQAVPMYGVIRTKQEVTHADLIKLNNFTVHHLNNFDRLYLNYTLNQKQRVITTNNGSLVMTDDTSYLYCKKPFDIVDNLVIINTGTVNVPELETIEVFREKPLIGVYTSNGIFEICKLAEDIELIYSSITN